MSFHASVARLVSGPAAEPVSPQEEAELIEAAQYGHEGATLQLVHLYAPAVRNAIARSSAALDRDDATQEALVAFLDLIKTHDATLNPRLAGRVKQVFTEALSDAATSEQAMHIPPRTLKRYLAILKKADGDVMAGASLAEDHHMSREVFLAIASATRVDSLTVGEDGDSSRIDTAVVLASEGRSGYADVEDALMADLALSLVEGDALQVTRHAYGFDTVVVDGHIVTPEGSAPVSDTLVGAALTLSRAKVQRLRSGALSTMREALAVEEVVA